MKSKIAHPVVPNKAAERTGAIKSGSQAARPERPRKKIAFQTNDIQMAAIVFVKFVEFVANKKK